jgi:dihydrofolate reductase
MRKLKLQMQLSIDGFVSAGKPGVRWNVWDFGRDWTWGPDLRRYHIDLTASIDCVLLSGNMAREGFIDHWADMSGRTSNPQSEFARNITGAQKVVFSKTLKASRWENTQIASGDLAEGVNALKAQGGKDMIVYGGASFVSALIKAHLIDEYHLVINPVILGTGVPIFDKIHSLINLSLIDARAYEKGMVVLIYAYTNHPATSSPHQQIKA